VRRRVALLVAHALMRLPHRIWRSLPDRLLRWAIDEHLWSCASVRHLYASPAAMRAALDRIPSPRRPLRRVGDALDPGGV